MPRSRKIRLPIPDQVRQQENQYYADQGRSAFRMAEVGRLGDPYCNLIEYHLYSFVPPRIEFGKIIEAIPHLRNYVVKTASGSIISRCVPLLWGPSSIIGASNQSTLPPGTPVCLIRDPATGLGFIIGAVPKGVVQAADMLSDNISGYFLFSAGNSQAFQHYLLPDKISGAIHCGLRSPIDSTEAGEFCITSEMGGMLFLDSFMAFMRANERSGIWFFQFDDLVRLVAGNLQEWVPGAIREIYQDQGEVAYYEGIGLEGNCLPVLEVFRGMPAFSEKKILKYAPTGLSDVDSKNIGLIEETWSDAAVWSLLALRGFILSQATRSTTAIWRTRRPDDPAGDDVTKDYSPELIVREIGPPNNWQNLADKVKTAISYFNSQPFDKLAYQTRIEALRHFAAHSKDYYVRRIPANRPIPNLASYSVHKGLNSLQTTVPIHQEGGSQPLTACLSGGFMVVNEDGSVHIGDGYGASIRMERGRLYISAPEIFISSGRNMAIWAGKGLYLRAREHVELVSSTSSVSVKAQTDLRLLGGNDGNGEVLLESKGGTITIANSSSMTEEKNPVIQLKNNGDIGMYASDDNVIWSRAGVLSSKGVHGIICDDNSLQRPDYHKFKFDSPAEEYVIADPLYGALMREAGIVQTWQETEIVGADPPNNKPWGTREGDQIYIQESANIPEQIDATGEYNFGTVTVTTLDGNWPIVP